MKNKCSIKGGVAEMTILRRKTGEQVTVKFDADDLPKVSAFKSWHVKSGREGRRFVASSLAMVDDPRGEPSLAQPILLNRYIAGTPDHLECCFVNGDPMDCRKSNLRNSNSTEKMQHGVYRIRRLGFRSIYRRDDCPEKPWLVKVMVDGVWKSKCVRTIGEAVKFRKQCEDEQVRAAWERIKQAKTLYQARQAVANFRYLDQSGRQRKRGRKSGMEVK